MEAHKMDGLDGIVLHPLFFLGEEFLSGFLAVAEATRHWPFRSTEEVAKREEGLLSTCKFGKDHLA